MNAFDTKRGTEFLDRVPRTLSHIEDRLNSLVEKQTQFADGVAELCKQMEQLNTRLDRIGTELRDLNENVSCLERSF